VTLRGADELKVSKVRSPMPFGGPFPGDPECGSCHQWPRGSPMPFGGPFPGDRNAQRKVLIKFRTSPMPFGGPFPGDMESDYFSGDGRMSVSNAFRRSVPR